MELLTVSTVELSHHAILNCALDLFMKGLLSFYVMWVGFLVNVAIAFFFFSFLFFNPCERVMFHETFQVGRSYPHYKLFSILG